ncbi:hypothetical protein [Paenibacillus odorifer]|nr:hypothetical protein [Paenibacillus odorifer]
MTYHQHTRECDLFVFPVNKMAYLSAKVSTSEERRTLLHFALQGHGFVFLADLFYERNHLKDVNVQLDKALVMCNSSKRVGARGCFAS